MALEPRPPKNTKPNFQLTHKIPISISRVTPGAYVGGRWVEGTPLPIEIQGNLQPLRFHEIMQLPESDRTKEWIKVYSAEEMYTSVEGVDGRQADIIHWEGKDYKVMRCRHYVMGVLDHFHSLAAREPLSAL
jgi:hypothetical protein